ncbi:flagellar hook-associated protein 2 [Alkalibacterium subtropicum]|uniref:Flagellar hook-associated protein 2 n=1 Tax=Alkalibacterium subtropicum TaxID=753702 RepID=A0A1I1IUM5_9LACT|nr:flagellar filament capping protein FliD [Alkalibacterium subtropicum]SFC39936.1 flagellar hook-associated protein 2 [Alkalibacterium subtropicum]
MNIMGMYSGMDMSMVEQLIQAESSRKVKFTQKKEQYTQSQNAWKDLNTRLDSLYKRLDDVRKTESFNSKTVELTGEENLAVTADEGAATGEYRVQVQQLATQTRLTGDRVTTDSIHSELSFSGDLTLTTGTGSFNVTVEAADSLKSISDKINGQTEETGVQASIVDNRLILSHNEYGLQDLTVSGTGTLTADLGLDAATAVPGKSALFTVDGLAIERTTNTIDDVIEGLSFELTNIHEGSEETKVSVTADMDKAAETLEKFVEQYNSTQSYIKTQLDVGDPSAENNKTGKLSGDGTLMRLQSNLRKMMTKQSTTTSSVSSLADLGVEISRDGTASFDREKLEEQIKSDPNAVSDFFSRTETVPETTDANGDIVPATTKKVGFSEDMRSFVDEYISSSSGIIKTRNDTYDRMIRDVDDRISQFEDRLEAKKARYIKEFTALDTAMMQAESQLEQMYSQLGMGQE